MKLYLVRQGDAVSEAEAGSDRDRWLSMRGRELARGLARLLREHGVEPDLIVSSPYPRATQTAELLANGLDYLGHIPTLRCLEPSAQPRVAAQTIGEQDARVLIAVSHEPCISELSAFVVSRPAFVPYRTAQACSFDHGRPMFTFRADVMNVHTLFVD